MPAETVMTEQLAVERLHEWLTVYARSGGRIEIRHDAESDCSSDVAVVLRADRDAVLGNAILGALAVWGERAPRAAWAPQPGDHVLVEVDANDVREGIVYERRTDMPHGWTVRVSSNGDDVGWAWAGAFTDAECSPVHGQDQNTEGRPDAGH